MGCVPVFLFDVWVNTSHTFRSILLGLSRSLCLSLDRESILRESNFFCYLVFPRRCSPLSSQFNAPLSTFMSVFYHNTARRYLCHSQMWHSQYLVTLKDSAAAFLFFAIRGPSKPKLSMTHFACPRPSLTPDLSCSPTVMLCSVLRGSC